MTAAIGRISRFAVLLTYYNEGPLLTRCLLSLVRQTRTADEIVLYDDASTIRPEPYIPDGLAVRVIRGEENIGPARGRNRLLEHTDAELIHFHDADDEFRPQWCEAVRGCFEEKAADAVFTEATFTDDNERTVERMFQFREHQAARDFTRFCIRGALITSSGSYRRALIDQLGGYRASLWQAEDWDLHIRLSARAARIELIDEPLVIIHGRAQSRSQLKAEVWRSAVQAIEMLATELPRQSLPDLSDAAAHAGAMLFRAGAIEDARRAFALARRLGRPALNDRPFLYRCVARIAGQETAERASQIYRSCLPTSFRKFVNAGHAH